MDPDIFILWLLWAKLVLNSPNAERYSFELSISIAIFWPFFLIDFFPIFLLFVSSERLWCELPQEMRKIDGQFVWCQSETDCRGIVIGSSR